MAERRVEGEEGDRDSRPSRPIRPTCRRCCRDSRRCAPLITDINLSLDDKQLYVSCWGTGELRQYDVTDPFNPRLTATTQIGGIVRRAAHPAQPSKRLNGGPQMVELSRDGRRVYLTNGLYSPWDEQFYPAGLESWMVKLDTKPERRHGARPQVLPGDGARGPLPPGPAPGRRRVVGLVLLLVTADGRTAVDGVMRGA